MDNNLIDLLCGKWRLSRKVKEFNITMIGTAEFAPLDKLSLCYKESGNYTLKQNEYNFFQKYTFAIQANKLLIIKNDASVLHEFTIPETTTYPVTLQHVHVCGRDTYNCQLILHNSDFFEMLYEVKGQNKNYTIETNFNRTKPN